MPDSPETPNGEQNQSFDASKAREDFLKEVSKKPEDTIKDKYDGDRFWQDTQIFESILTRKGLSNRAKDGQISQFLTEERELLEAALRYDQPFVQTMELLSDSVIFDQHPKSREIALSIIEDNLDFIGQALGADSESQADIDSAAFYTLAHFAGKGSNDQADKAAVIFAQNKDKILAGLAGEKKLGYKRLVGYLAEASPNKDISQTVDYILAGFVKEVESAEDGSEEVYDLAIAMQGVEYSPFRREKVGFFAKEILRDFGFDPEQVVDTWRLNSGNEFAKVNEMFASNLRSMIFLESQERGSTKVLNEKFGIVNFGRYPPELLLRQYQNRDRDDLRYGVGLYPLRDHNGAAYGQRGPLESLLEDLGDQFELRVAEAESKVDVANHLRHFRARYGKHRISFAIIFGHGSEDSISFGDHPSRSGEARYSLTSEDLVDSRSGKYGSFFEDKPTIILASCSTGVDQGIAQKLKETLGAEVVAPTEEAGLKSYHAKIEGGNISLSALYKYKSEEGVSARVSVGRVFK